MHKAEVFSTGTEIKVVCVGKTCFAFLEFFVFFTCQSGEEKDDKALNN